MAKRGPKPGSKLIRKLTDRDKHVSEKSGRGLTKGHWEVRNGKKVWVKD